MRVILPMTPTRATAIGRKPPVTLAETERLVSARKQPVE